MRSPRRRAGYPARPRPEDVPRGDSRVAGVSTVATSLDEPPTFAYALTVARKRDDTVSFADDDIRGRSFAHHALRAGADGEWRYGTGSIEVQGVVSIDFAMGPGLDSVPPRPPHGATLVVDAAGIVSDGGAFAGFLTADKNTLVSVFTDPAEGTPSYQLAILQFTGGTFTQADLQGEWAFSSLAGNVSPSWWQGSVDIDAAGTAQHSGALRDRRRVEAPGARGHPAAAPTSRRGRPPRRGGPRGTPGGRA